MSQNLEIVDGDGTTNHSMKIIPFKGNFFKKDIDIKEVYIFPSSLQVLQESRSLLMKVFFFAANCDMNCYY